jgi:hypothetical protein
MDLAYYRTQLVRDSFQIQRRRALMCTIEDTSRAHRSADKEESLCAKSFTFFAKRRAIISANGRFGHIAAGPLDRSPNDPLGFDHLKAEANRQRAGGSVEISPNSRLTLRCTLDSSQRWIASCLHQSAANGWGSPQHGIS